MRRQPIIPIEENPPEGATRMRPLVLVVDDDSGLRESLRVILEDEYEVLDVPNGLQALDIVRSCQVDLVLLDVRLPGMDGSFISGMASKYPQRPSRCLC